jgi:hypothetical protein
MGGITRRKQRAGQQARLLLRMMIALLAVAGLGVQTGGTALATNYSGASGSTSNCPAGPGGNNMQDPNPHTIYYDSLEQSVRDHMEWARWAVVDPTTVDSQLVSSATSLTDVVVYDQDYTTYCGLNWHDPGPEPNEGFAGYVFCVSLTSNNKCEKHELRIDLSWWNTSFAGADNNNMPRRYMACHEMGHTLGVRHPNRLEPEDSFDSCMVPGQAAPDYIAMHDACMINGICEFIAPNQELRYNTPGYWDRIRSRDGRWVAVMQDDGNFVIRDTQNGWDDVWDTQTGGNLGAGIFAVMQGDGNFVMRRNYTSALCSTRTAGNVGAFMVLQTDANLVIRSPVTWQPIWSRYAGGQCYR